MAEGGGGANVPQGASQFWQNLGALVSVVSVVIGLVASYFAYVAKNQADKNSNELATLKTQFEQAEQFAKDLREGRDVMSHRDPSVAAVIEYISIYAASETVDRKLLLVETAQAAHDAPSMKTLADLMSHDDSVQNPLPADAAKARVIKTTIRAISETAYNNKTQAPVPQNFHDVKASAIKDPLTAANGKVVAALTQLGTSGWIFIGDIPSDSSTATRPLVGDYIDSTSVPSQRSVVTARAGLNVRVAPYVGNKLGETVGVAAAGSELTIDLEPRRLPYRSRAHNGARWQAIWAHVTLHSK